MCMYTCMHSYIYECIHIYVCIYLSVYMFVCVYIRIHIYTYIYIFITRGRPLFCSKYFTVNNVLFLGRFHPRHDRDRLRLARDGLRPQTLHAPRERPRRPGGTYLTYTYVTIVHVYMYLHVVRSIIKKHHFWHHPCPLCFFFFYKSFIQTTHF